MLHHRFTRHQQQQRLPAPQPTETVLLLLRFFEDYLQRFEELHLFSPRISSLVETLDNRSAYYLSPYFIRDHVWLLFVSRDVLKWVGWGGMGWDWVVCVSFGGTFSVI